jgi:hypothetical protein
MTTEADEQTPSLLVVADHLEWWANSLPNREEGDKEPWHEVLERRYRAETALIKRLRHAPKC